MITLLIDSASKSAAAGIAADGVLVASEFQNSGYTHSQTLLPMIDRVVRQADISPADIGLVAVTAGPGSFTGVRIGMSTAKGIAFGCGCEIVPVSSLESLAYSFVGAQEVLDGSLICAAFDARRGQVYNAVFCYDGGLLRRLRADRVCAVSEVFEQEFDRRLYIAGDGAPLFLPFASPGRLVVPDINITAGGIMAAAEGKSPVCAEDAVPCYLRSSQAEREYGNTGRKL